MKPSGTLTNLAICLSLVVTVSAQQGDSCKPVQHYGVKGCQLLPDKTCPSGYHKQAVNPPNPQMMGPTFLMCVADKAPEKGQPPKQEPQKGEK